MQEDDWRRLISWEESGQLCAISLPSQHGKDVTSVCFPVQLMKWLTEEIEAETRAGDGGRETGGLLIGSISCSSGDSADSSKCRVVLELYVPLPRQGSEDPYFHLSPGDKQEVRDFFTGYEGSPYTIAGLYRTHRRSGSARRMQLDAEDRELANEFLVAAGSIFFVLQPHANHIPLAALFIREGESFSTEPALVFPFDYTALGGVAASQLVSSMANDLPASDTTWQQPTPRHRATQIWITAGAALVLAAGALVTQKFWFKRQLPSEQFSGAPSVSVPLQLHSAFEHDHLRIDWNPDAQRLLSADTGVLAIQDGETSTRITLDSTVLRHGSVEYHAKSEMVKLRLTIGQVSEMAIVAGIHSADHEGSLAESPISSTPPSESAQEEHPARPGRLRPGLVGASRPEISAVTRVQSQPPVVLTPPPAINSPEPRLPDVAKAPILPAPSQLRPDIAPPVPTTQPQLVPTSPAPVSPSVAYVAAQVKKRVMPEFSASVDRLMMSKVTIQVRVSIDDRGRVVRAESLTRGEPLVEYLSSVAVSAARRWVFEPARRGEMDVASETVLNFDFQRNQ